MSKNTSRCLTLESSVKTLALKFYDEQLIASFGTQEELNAANSANDAVKKANDALKNASVKDRANLETAFKQALQASNKLVYDIVDTKGYYQTLCDRIKAFDPDTYQCLTICHDKDFLEDNFFVPSAEKRHYHLIERFTPKQGIKRVPLKVRTWLNALGLKYRAEYDADLILNKGIETVNDFGAYVDYLTHEDKASVLAGKTRYDRDELVSNLSKESIDEIRKGFTGVVTPHKWDRETFQSICESAFKVGYAGQSYTTFADSIGRFVLYSQSKEKVVRRFYDDGLADRINEHREIDRLCLYIQGSHNFGKSRTAELALEALGISGTLAITNNGTGKFDAVSVANNAIILDDVTGKDMFNLSDQYECRLYKRNSGDAIWAGSYLIVTNNHPFEDWLKRSAGLTPDISGKLSVYDQISLDALKSRWFVITVSDKVLPGGNVSSFPVIKKVWSASRGNKDKQTRPY